MRNRFEKYLIQGKGTFHLVDPKVHYHNPMLHFEMILLRFKGHKIHCPVNFWSKLQCSYLTTTSCKTLVAHFKRIKRVLRPSHLNFLYIFTITQSKVQFSFFCQVGYQHISISKHPFKPLKNFARNSVGGLFSI